MSTYQSLPNLLDFFSYFFFTSSLKYSSVTLFALSTVVFLSLSAAPRSRIPVLRQRKWFGSVWYDSMLYLSNSRDILRDGYNKYTKAGQFFQIATPYTWLVVVPQKYAAEIVKAPEEYLSHKQAAKVVVQPGLTISPIVEQNQFHLQVIQTSMTPNIGRKLEDMLDEIEYATSIDIGVSTDWKAVVMSPTAHFIMARVINRVLVGTPLCRNEEYLQMCALYAVASFRAADKLRAYPDVLKSLFKDLTTDIPKLQQLARKHLIPYITQRLADSETHNKGQNEDGESERPNDLLQWVIDAAPSAVELDPDRLMYRMIHVQVAALYTSSSTFLNCLFDLAATPEIHDDLRQELRTVLKDNGWTLQGLDEMRKLDSFMLESQRLSPLAGSQLTRAVLRDFTFSNGTVVRAGSYVVVPMEAMYQDDEIFSPDATQFDPLRFFRQNSSDGSTQRQRYVTASAKHLSFGLGRSACPGRFLVEAEIKVALGFLLLNYDIKLGGRKPVETWYDRTRTPDRTAEVLFRRRI